MLVGKLRQKHLFPRTNDGIFQIMKKEKSQKAREAIEGALMVIKSVEFLEGMSLDLMKKIDLLDEQYEKSTDFLERERLIIEIDKLQSPLRQLIRRCELEYININKIKSFII